MATAGDGKPPYESGKKFNKRPFSPAEIIEEPQNVTQEAAGRINSTGASNLSTHQGGNFASIHVTIGKSELKQMLEQMTFTSSETECLIALLHSRTIKEPTATGSMKRNKHGDKRDNIVHASVISSKVFEEEIVSPAELANAYKGSTIGTGQSLRQNSNLINNKATSMSKRPMASPQHPTTMENLPDELLSNIFIRLLAKQLAQMRSVSKSWNAFLSHSSLVKCHLDRSLLYDDQVLLFFNDYTESKPFTAHPCRSPHLELPNFIKLPVYPHFEYTDITIIGSINGLICSSYSNSVIQIWNPSLSAVLTLPPYSMPAHGYDSIMIWFRFGFDPKTDDYKVVKLTCLVTGSYLQLVTWWLQVEIYSMRRGSWELITESFPSHMRSIDVDDGVCADGHDGHIHWLGYTSGNRDSVRILAFDLGSETFREIPPPDPTVGRNYASYYLVVLGTKLCVMTCSENDVFEVWVMDEYGVAESWVKRHVFSQFTCNTFPYGFTSYNELLFEDYGSIVLCDLIANTRKTFENYCMEYHRPQKIVKYVDSLVWIAPVEHEMDGAARK